MKTRILVSAVSLALALATLPASADLLIEGDPRGRGSPSEGRGSSLSSNYHEVRFDDGVSQAPASAVEKSRAEASLVIVPATTVGSTPARNLATSSLPMGSTPSTGSNPTAFSAYISHSGTQDHSLAKVAGGTDVLLSDALRKVIPSDFRLVDNQVHLRKLATWTGNRSWVDVLADLGRAANFVSHINWSTREVSLAPASVDLTSRDTSEYRPLPPQVAQVRESREIQVVDKTPAAQPAVVAPSAPVAPPIPTWTLDSKLTLRENVEEWSKKAGWTVVWDAVDYPVFATATFKGEFSDSNGPLAQLFNGYSASDQPLLVRLTSKDRVVYVRNRILERSEITGLPPTFHQGTF